METCHALASRGHHVSLAVRPDTHDPKRDPFTFYGLRRVETLHVETVPLGGPPAARRAGYVAFAIARAMGRVRQDVIFTRDLGVASVLARLPRLARGPVVYEAHTIAADEAAARHEMLTGAPVASPAKLRRLAARDAGVWCRTDGYVTITHGLKSEMERRFGARENIAVVPDGARAVAVGAPPGAEIANDREGGDSLAARPFTIGYAGHLYPWKGVDLIIEAVSALRDTRGLIVGGHEQERDLERVKALAVRRDCASRVTFTGLLPPGEVAARLRDADALVLPNPASAVSNAFTSPLKLFEYMAAGRPIVASDLPSIREVLTHGRNALLIAPGNPQALTAAIRRLEDDRALGRLLARQALSDVADYTWTKRAERLEALFEALA
jgi:glycosyltransferase involved in cell wall biosynthesis